MAGHYDHLLRHVDYNKWYRYLRALMLCHVDSPQLIMEMGTGTGKFGARFSADGYRILGVDLAFDMLLQAKRRTRSSFMVACGDARNFSLRQKADFIFSVHDTVNYLVRDSDVEAFLRRCRDNLSPRGALMFDITTEYNIRRYFHLQSERTWHDGTIIVWDNEYDERRRLIHSNLTFNHEDGSVTRETHTQKIYTIDEIKKILHRTGFTVEAVYGTTFDAPRPPAS